MHRWLRIGLMIVALGSADGGSAQGALTQRDGQGAVTVVVTLAGLPDVGVPIRATVVLDTHTVALNDVVFERVVALSPSYARRPAKEARRGRSGCGSIGHD